MSEAEATEGHGMREFEIDLTLPPIHIGAAMAGAFLPLVHDVAEHQDPSDRVAMLHGFCAAVFGAMSGMIGLDCSDQIIEALKEYSQRMRLEEDARGGIH